MDAHKNSKGQLIVSSFGNIESINLLLLFVLLLLFDVELGTGVVVELD